MKLQSFLMFLIIVFSTSCLYAETLTLDRSIGIALENNLDIKQEEILLKITSYKERAARALFYPSLSLNGNELYYKDVPLNSQFLGVAARQPLYTGGKLTNDLKSAQESNNAQFFNLHNIELTLESQVFKEYMNCLRYWKYSKAYKDAIDRANAQLDSVREEIKKGKRGEEDTLRWQVLIDNYSEKMISANKDLANSKVRLNTLMNRDAYEPVEVSDSHLLRFEYTDFIMRQKQYSGEEMMNMFNDYALIFSPAYKKKSTEVLIANYNLRAEQATLRPNIDILAYYDGYPTPLLGVYNNWNVGMYLSFDIYKQPKYENIKISKLQLDLSKAKEQTYLRDLKSNVRTLYVSNSSNNENVTLQRKQQKTSMLYLKEISERYKTGGASNLDVVEAFSSFYTNQVALVDSIYNAYTEFANLYNMIGFSFLYNKPSPNIYWRYKERGLQLDYGLKTLDDGTFQFMDNPYFEKVKSVFMNNTYLLKTHDKTGQTALHYAVDRGYSQCVEFLLKNRADPNAVNFLDGTPLVRAIIYCPADKNLAITKLLIKFGADVNQVSHNYTPLNWAAMKNKIDLVKALVHAGAKVNVQDMYLKLTPLHFSAFWGNVDMTKFLIESGADILIENSDGMTPYDLAWQFEYMDMVKFFEKLPAK